MRRMRMGTAGVAAAALALSAILVVGGSPRSLSTLAEDTGERQRPGSPAEAAPPRRIVSLNLCIDPIVLDLVPRERIAGLSLVSADSNVSAIAGRIGGLTLVRGLAEEVLALDPDLVLAGAYTTTATVDLLRRLGRRVEVVPLATDIDGIRATIRRVATAVGEPARGEDLVATFDARLAAAQPAGTGRPSAILYQMNGIASGPGSLAATAFEWTGLRNKAADLVLGRGGQVSLEALAIDPPDLVTLGQRRDTYLTPLADNLRHPALAWLLGRRAHIDLPMPLWLCGTPQLADAAAALAQARSRLLAGERN